MATAVNAGSAAAAPSGYVAGSALIDGDSVTTVDGITDSSGNPISLEQYAAQKAGFTVTVVTGATWSAMTTAQFAQYQLLIVGDPDCSVTPTSATASASTWAPVVMGTSGLNPNVGNRTLIGTDPEFHYLNGGGGAQPTNPSDPTTAGAEHLVQDGIAYAGGVAGATGAYFDSTCEDNGSDAAVMNMLTSVGTGFTTNDSPPCGGSVSLIAANPAFVSLSDTDIQGWGCSDHITFPTFPTDWQPLAVATDTATTPTCGTDPDTDTTACGQAYVLVAGEGIVVTAPNLSLTPTSASYSAGGTATVTATVTQSGTPLSGATVSFAVTGQNAGVAGTCVPAGCVTNSSGQVAFTYSDTNGVGTDTVNAGVTISGSTEHATAAVTWTATGPASTTTTTKLSGGGSTGTTITVPAGTSVSDSAVIAGANSASATGTVTYSVFSNRGCTTAVGSPATVTVTAGSVPSSTATTYSTPGTYYFTASYSGDANNAASASSCGSEVLAVAPVTGTAPSIDDRSTLTGNNTASDDALRPTASGDLLVAFVTADGPSSGGQQLTVSGSGLSWTRVAADSSAKGDAEVWMAHATTAKNYTVTVVAKLKGYAVVLNDVAFKNASGIGASATAHSAAGAPSVTLTTTQGQSWVWATGNDWSHATARTVGAGQTLQSQTLNKTTKDTYWTQSTTAPTAAPGSVTLNDTAPAGDPFNLVAVEIL